MPGIPKLIRLGHRVFVYIPPPSPMENEDHEIWMDDGHFSQKLGLKPQNFEISSGTIDAKRLWDHLTFYTAHIFPLVNGDFEGEGTKTN